MREYFILSKMVNLRKVFSCIFAEQEGRNEHESENWTTFHLMKANCEDIIQKNIKILEQKQKVHDLLSLDPLCDDEETVSPKYLSRKILRLSSRKVKEEKESPLIERAYEAPKVEFDQNEEFSLLLSIKASTMRDQEARQSKRVRARNQYGEDSCPPQDGSMGSKKLESAPRGLHRRRAGLHEIHYPLTTDQPDTPSNTSDGNLSKCSIKSRQTSRRDRRRKNVSNENNQQSPGGSECSQRSSSWQEDPIMVKYRDSAFAMVLREREEMRKKGYP